MNKGGQITIKDIARELKISPSTVSRALKDHPDISQQTKKQVKELAEKLNYQPNTLAMGLRQKKSNTIGVIIPEIVHFFFSTVISGIEDVAYSKGYSVIFSQSGESQERERLNIQEMFNHRVDGYLISVSKNTSDPTHLNAIIEKGIPLVFFDRAFDGVNCSKVLSDDFTGGYEATKHLLDQGYRRIAHLAGPQNLEISNRRLEGYKKALMDFGLGIDSNLIFFEEDSSNEEYAYNLTLQLLEKRGRPQAIFAHNDLAAIGVKSAVKSKGLSIPEDMAIVGISNWHLTSLTDPPLSTVAQPGFEIGQQACELLIKEIESKETEYIEPETKVLPTELIIRKSSIKPE